MTFVTTVTVATDDEVVEEEDAGGGEEGGKKSGVACCKTRRPREKDGRCRQSRVAIDARVFAFACERVCARDITLQTDDGQRGIRRGEDFRYVSIYHVNTLPLAETAKRSARNESLRHPSETGKRNVNA